MDPDITLAEIRRLTKEILSPKWDMDFMTANALADYCAALDEWIKNGGYLPNDWKHAKKSGDTLGQ